MGNAALSRVKQTAAQVAQEWELKALAEDVLVNIQNAPPESPKALGALLREIAGQHFRQQATARKIVNTFIELIRK
jgi:hypothetical protein